MQLYESIREFVLDKTRKGSGTFELNQASLELHKLLSVIFIGVLFWWSFQFTEP